MGNSGTDWIGSGGTDMMCIFGMDWQCRMGSGYTDQMGVMVAWIRLTAVFGDRDQIGSWKWQHGSTEVAQIGTVAAQRWRQVAGIALNVKSDS